MSNTVAVDQTVSLIKDRLNLNSLRQKVVASNLANANTPDYIAKDVSFEKTLRESLERDVLNLVRSNEEHLAGESPLQEMHEPEVVDTGPVSLEQEMMKLTENTVEYQFFLTMLNKKFDLLKTAIQGR